MFYIIVVSSGIYKAVNISIFGVLLSDIVQSGDYRTFGRNNCLWL